MDMLNTAHQHLLRATRRRDKVSLQCSIASPPHHGCINIYYAEIREFDSER
jgi:hypothetical protein